MSENRGKICNEVFDRLTVLSSRLAGIALSEAIAFSEAEAALSMASLVVREQERALFRAPLASSQSLEEFQECPGVIATRSAPEAAAACP
jgi:Tfp pilus assembly protein PilX